MIFIEMKNISCFFLLWFGFDNWGIIENRFFKEKKKRVYNFCILNIGRDLFVGFISNNLYFGFYEG